MPRPSTGSLTNAGTLLSAFGEDIILEDASVIAAIVRTRKELVYNGSEAIERSHTVLSVPVVSQGSLRQGQYIMVRNVRFYVASIIDKGDDWRECGVSLTP